MIFRAQDLGTDVLVAIGMSSLLGPVDRYIHLCIHTYL